MDRKQMCEGEVRWGVIGAGDVCEIKSAPAMNVIPRSRVQAVMRRNADKAQDYAKRHGVETWYSDASQLIEDSQVNAIYIATPPSSHEALCVQAAEAGKPVYVEKPMATSVKACARMNEACEKAGVPLFVAYYRRALPNVLQVKSLLEQNAIGDIRTVSVELKQASKPEDSEQDNWRIQPDFSGGGYFFDLASHQLDLIDFLLGPVERVHGLNSNQAGLYQAEDVVCGAFSLKSGVMGTGHWCFTVSEFDQGDAITIVGSKGSIKFTCFGSANVEVVSEEGRVVTEHVYPKHIQEHLIAQVVADLLGNGKCSSTGHSAARTNWVLSRFLAG